MQLVLEVHASELVGGSCGGCVHAWVYLKQIWSHLVNRLECQ